MADGEKVLHAAVEVITDSYHNNTEFIWPWWWWIALLLGLLLLLLLIACCFAWCIFSNNYGRRKRRVIVSEQTRPLMHTVVQKSDNGEINQNMKQLESRVDLIREQLESKIVTDHHYYHDSRDGDRDSDSSSDDGRKEKVLRGKGEFEDGYLKGFRDASKTTGAGAREKLDASYAGMTGEFHTGYVQGLRDAGLTGMSQSMHDLASRQQNTGGYSAGYMQGFRDGNSGIYGDRITTSLLTRLEDQYPNQDDYRQGYIEGFRDSTNKTQTIQRAPPDDGLGDRLTELNQRLVDLEKMKSQLPVEDAGEELHSTRIYHVYNQVPTEDGKLPVAYASAGQQLGKELDMESASRRSTLRKHYTSGDYHKHAGDLEAYGDSVQRSTRRTLSSSSVGRGN